MSLTHGFSLPEVLISVAIGSTLMLSTVKLLPALQLAVLRQTQDVAVQEDLWQLALLVGKHLQRAGYCAGNCRGDGLVLSRDGQCVISRWDANNNGSSDTSSAEPEQTGFRLREGALEIARGTASCNGNGWEKISEPALFTVTRFEVSQRPLKGYAPRFVIALEGVSARYGETPRTVMHQVTGYNLP